MSQGCNKYTFFKIIIITTIFILSKFARLQNFFVMNLFLTLCVETVDFWFFWVSRLALPFYEFFFCK